MVVKSLFIFVLISMIVTIACYADLKSKREELFGNPKYLNINENMLSEGANYSDIFGITDEQAYYLYIQTLEDNINKINEKLDNSFATTDEAYKLLENINYISDSLNKLSFYAEYNRNGDRTAQTKLFNSAYIMSVNVQNKIMAIPQQQWDKWMMRNENLLDFKTIYTTIKRRSNLQKNTALDVNFQLLMENYYFTIQGLEKLPDNSIKKKVTNKEGNPALLMGQFLRPTYTQEKRKEAYTAYQNFFNIQLHSFANAFLSPVYKEDYLSIGNPLLKYTPAEYIPEDIETFLVENAQFGYDYFHRYQSLKGNYVKNYNNIPSLAIYDFLLPYRTGKKIEYSVQETVGIYQKATAMLGSEYASCLSAMLDNNRIIVHNRSSFTYNNFDDKPFVFLFSLGSLNDIFTFTHEIGHASHTILCNNNQKYFNQDYSQIIGETVAALNELMLYQELHKQSSDIKAELDIYMASKLEAFAYYMFLKEFELYVLKEFNQKNISYDVLYKFIVNQNKKIFGQNYFSSRDDIDYAFFIILQKYKIMKASIIDRYLLSQIAAVTIFHNMHTLQGEAQQKYIQAYIDMLKAGGSKDSFELLKTVGVDFKEKKLYVTYSQYLKNLIENFEKVSLL